MDRWIRSTRMGFTCALALTVLGASASESTARLRARLLPDLFTHLSYGEKNVDAGNALAALAHSDVVLLRGTVRVHVAFEAVDQRRQAGCLAALKAGIGVWHDAIAPETEFLVVDDPACADVQVTFRPHLTVDGKAVGGHTQWRRAVKALGDGTYSASVTATVELVANCPNGSAMSAGQMQQAAAHEFGHVLGLQDSARAGDVMGALDLRRPVLVPAPEEIEALAEIREEARGLRVRALALQTDPSILAPEP